MFPVLQVLAVILLANALLCLLRVALGPTLPDRLLAVNVVGTKTLVLLALIAHAFDREMFADVAIVYGLLNYVIALAASRMLETGRLKGNPR